MEEGATVTPGEERAEGPPEGGSRNGLGRAPSRARWILPVVVLAAAVGGYFAWSHYSIRETTDDAQIDGHINPVSAKVGGTVSRVLVEDNQRVEAGALLVEIDPRDYRVAVDRAQANLAAEQATAKAAQTVVPITSTTSDSQSRTAEANVRAAEAGLAAARKEVSAAEAELKAAEARLRETEARSRLAQQNLERLKPLVERDEISRQQWDGAVAEEEATRAAVEAARAAIARAEQAVPVAESHVAQAQAARARAQADEALARTGPQRVAVSRAESGSAEAKIEQSRANLAMAELNLEYTQVKAPVGGVVSMKSVEVGEVIQAGQLLMAIVPLDEIWVTANFKETQLEHMSVGQPVTVSVDAYGDRKFEGRVESIAAATGSKFSLLPAENATGNYVKVVQRIPVKITLDVEQDAEHVLRPGMSVVATVLTQ